MAREIICGIYCIENTINHKKYIGSSVDIYRRWAQHRRELKGNYHYNHHLQNACNKYKIENFKFYIIERCDECIRIEKEQYWIDCYNSANENFGYNIAQFAGLSGASNVENNLMKGNYIISSDDFQQIVYYLCNTKESIVSISKKLNISLDLIHSIYQHKAYKSLTSSMVFPKRRPNKSKLAEITVREIVRLLLEEKTYDEISKVTNVDKKTISEIRSKHTWKWLTENIIFPDLKISHPNHRRKINQYTINGLFIKTYDSATDAIDELSNTTINYSSIVASCVDDTNNRTSGGYIWKYYDEYPKCNNIEIKKKIPKRNRIPINQYSEDGIFIKTYSSYYEGYKETGINPSTISKACKTGKIASGYMWKYAMTLNATSNA